MNILIGCEESQTICLAFRKKGHNAFSCDTQPCSGGHPEFHIQRDIRQIIMMRTFTTQDGTMHTIDKWDMLIAHPPCTYITVTGNKWFTEQPPRKSGALVGRAREEAREEAIQFFLTLARANIKRICLENPVGIMSTVWRKPDQIIQPFQFGHPEPKKTCLWLKHLPPLFPTQIVEPEYFISKSGKRLAKWYYMPSPSPERQKMRSVTFQGVADAMANQWNF
jgi:hypothetical protein